MYHGDVFRLHRGRLPCGKAGIHNFFVPVGDYSALAVLVSPTSKVPIKYMLVVSFILASISLKVTRLTSCNRSHHAKPLSHLLLLD